MNGIYKFSRAMEVVPDVMIYDDGEREENIGGVAYDMFKDEPVALELLDSGDILMTLRLPDTEDGNTVPRQMIISAEEFAELGLSFVGVGSVADLMESDSGYEFTQVAGSSRSRPRRHTARLEGSRRARGGFSRDGNGRVVGRNGNCVRVVKSMTGFSGTAGNGVGMANALARTGRWRVVSPSSRIAGMVCSWSGGRHGKGHVGYFDGSCFQPTYGGNCGSPGKSYRLRKCVARA
ncbi:MAG: hypothetical protein HC902_01650 [Calothrix sp. SM1_5_4]|nr:hypothetical protein [Calothrix sp. SM1_5_4]